MNGRIRTGSHKGSPVFGRHVPRGGFGLTLAALGRLARESRRRADESPEPLRNEADAERLIENALTFAAQHSYKYLDAPSLWRKVQAHPGPQPKKNRLLPRSLSTARDQRAFWFMADWLFHFSVPDPKQELRFPYLFDPPPKDRSTGETLDARDFTKAAKAIVQGFKKAFPSEYGGLTSAKVRVDIKRYEERAEFDYQSRMNDLEARRSR